MKKKYTLNIVQHRKYPLFTLTKRCIYKKIQVLTFEHDLGKVIRNVSQHPLHHVTYAPVKLEVATSNDLVTDVLEENTLLQGHTKRCPIPNLGSSLIIFYFFFIFPFLGQK